MPNESKSSKSGDRFRKTVCRVLIALSFKSFTHRTEPNRKRERSDCSEARFLPVVDEHGVIDTDDIMVRTLTYFVFSHLTIYLSVLYNGAFYIHSFTLHED